MVKKLIISGVGCSLVDNLYNNISFNADNFLSYLSEEKGDGGLTPGHLVFKEDFENFCKKRELSGLESIISGRLPDKINVGGPGIVSMIHTAQLSNKENCDFYFYGARGNDKDGNFIMSRLKKTPLLIDNYKLFNGETPSTVVLSDPDYNHGNGERIFINTIGAALNYSPELGKDFFDSDIVVFGGTAVLPQIHDNLTELLEKAKRNNCITIVNTVYDFINEKSNPGIKWPLGKSDDSYKNIDLLIMDHEEGIRLSGASDVDKAMQFFQEMGTGAVIITNGIEKIRFYSNGSLFQLLKYSKMPVSNAITDKIKKGFFGDTTGCGDNFAGGVIASLISQIQDQRETIELEEACIWGIVSGGATCFYIGGMYEEKFPGEKRKIIQPYFKQYKEQIKL